MEHYGTIAGADAYHASRGNDAWAEATTADKTAALVRASHYLDAVYTWPGQAATMDQALEWPRSGVTWRGQTVNDTAIPAPVERAAYEAALRELQAPGSLAPDFAPGEAVTSYTEQVGPLRESREYDAPTSAAGNRPKVLLIDGILRDLLGAGAGSANFRVTRV